MIKNDFFNLIISRNYKSTRVFNNNKSKNEINVKKSIKFGESYYKIQKRKRRKTKTT